MTVDVVDTREQSALPNSGTASNRAISEESAQSLVNSKSSKCKCHCVSRKRLTSRDLPINAIRTFSLHNPQILRLLTKWQSSRIRWSPISTSSRQIRASARVSHQPSIIHHTSVLDHHKCNALRVMLEVRTKRPCLSLQHPSLRMRSL